ncbi:MAG: hypothetical protein JW784_06430 [Candidatus Cloacimonetes bacterium]|nr:hypothetical protein [Candidatus Cloacimonadota bacterium]
MKGRISFSTIGNTYLHQMRDQINNAEDRADLGRSFSFTVTNFLKEVLSDHNLEIEDGDVIFDPEAKDFYSINEDLQNRPVFRELWQESDLASQLKKFAESTYHRYLHLGKHLEKTRLKIRN